MECITFKLVEIIAKIIGVNVKVPISSDKGCRFIEEAGEGNTRQC